MLDGKCQLRNRSQYCNLLFQTPTAQKLFNTNRKRVGNLYLAKSGDSYIHLFSDSRPYLALSLLSMYHQKPTNPCAGDPPTKPSGALHETCPKTPLLLWAYRPQSLQLSGGGELFGDPRGFCWPPLGSIFFQQIRAPPSNAPSWTACARCPCAAAPPRLWRESNLQGKTTRQKHTGNTPSGFYYFLGTRNGGQLGFMSTDVHQSLFRGSPLNSIAKLRGPSKAGLVAFCWGSQKTSQVLGNACQRICLNKRF